MKRILLVGAFLVVGAGLAACGDDDARDVLTVQVDGGTMSVSGDPSSGAVDVEINGDLEAGTEVDSPGCWRGPPPRTSWRGCPASSRVVRSPTSCSRSGVAAGGSSTPSVTLEPGSYFVWVETDNDGIVYTPLTVDGDGGGTDLPDTDGAFTTKDYGFTVDAKAGDTYTIVNDGSRSITSRCSTSVTSTPRSSRRTCRRSSLPRKAIRHRRRSPRSTSPISTSVGAEFGPGRSGTFEVTLEEGTTYAVVCFIPDHTGGPPHAFAHDMYDVFTVT